MMTCWKFGFLVLAATMLSGIGGYVARDITLPIGGIAESRQGVNPADLSILGRSKSVDVLPDQEERPVALLQEMRSIWDAGEFPVTPETWGLVNCPAFSEKRVLENPRLSDTLVECLGIEYDERRRIEDALRLMGRRLVEASKRDVFEESDQVFVIPALSESESKVLESDFVQIVYQTLGRQKGEMLLMKIREWIGTSPLLREFGRQSLRLTFDYTKSARDTLYYSEVLAAPGSVTGLSRLHFSELPEFYCQIFDVHEEQE